MLYFALYEQLKEIVQSEVFEITFVKKDGSTRVMKCTLTDHQETLLNGLCPVWDIENNGHRSVNLNKVVQMIFNDKAYTIKDEKWQCVSL